MEHLYFVNRNRVMTFASTTATAKVITCELRHDTDEMKAANSLVCCLRGGSGVGVGVGDV